MVPEDALQEGSGPVDVGIFDSGVGGLSVAASLLRLAPAGSVRVQYAADTAFFPYGDKAEADIRCRVLSLGRALAGTSLGSVSLCSHTSFSSVDAHSWDADSWRTRKPGCGMLVVACNTASSAALEELRAEHGPSGVGVVGVEPPLKPAALQSARKRVAVLATAGTVAGPRLGALCSAFGGSLDCCELIKAPGLADLVEAAQLNGAEVDALLARILAPALAQGVDTIALGCTHYGFVTSAIRRVCGDGVDVIDSAGPVARHILRRLGLEESARSSVDGGAGAGEVAVAVTGAGAGQGEGNDPWAHVRDGLGIDCLCTGDPGVFARQLEALHLAGADLPPLRVRGRLSF